jgi:hypothetical protein
MGTKFSKKITIEGNAAFLDMPSVRANGLGYAIRVEKIYANSM